MTARPRDLPASMNFNENRCRSFVAPRRHPTFWDTVPPHQTPLHAAKDAAVSKVPRWVATRPRRGRCPRKCHGVCSGHCGAVLRCLDLVPGRAKFLKCLEFPAACCGFVGGAYRYLRPLTLFATLCARIVTQCCGPTPRQTVTRRNTKCRKCQPTFIRNKDKLN